MKVESLHNAIMAHYTAKRAEAVAMLELIYNKSVAISEHVNILEETKRWVEQLEKAESCMNSLTNNIASAAPAPAPPQTGEQE